MFFDVGEFYFDWDFVVLVVVVQVDGVGEFLFGCGDFFVFYLGQSFFVFFFQDLEDFFGVDVCEWVDECL